MKKLNLLLTLVLCTALGTVNMNAQKIAHLNVDELLMQMPERLSAQQQLENLAKRHKTQLEKDQNTLGLKYQKLSQAAQSQTKTQQELQILQQELQTLQQQLQAYQVKAGAEIEAKQVALFKPIQSKLNNAISAAAKEKGYDYVLDASPGRGVLIANGFDLTGAVKKKLGL